MADAKTGALIERARVAAGLSQPTNRVEWAEPAELLDVQVDLAALDADLDAPNGGVDATAETDR